MFKIGVCGIGKMGSEITKRLLNVINQLVYGTELKAKPKN